MIKATIMTLLGVQRVNVIALYSTHLLTSTELFPCRVVVSIASVRRRPNLNKHVNMLFSDLCKFWVTGLLRIQSCDNGLLNIVLAELSVGFTHV